MSDSLVLVLRFMSKGETNNTRGSHSPSPNRTYRSPKLDTLYIRHPMLTQTETHDDGGDGPIGPQIKQYANHSSA